MPIQDINTSAPIYKEGEALKNWLRFACSSRQCLFIKLEQPEMEIMSFKEKQHVKIANNPRPPQCQTEAEYCLLPDPPLFVSIYL
jgi:hypothetical protein